MKWWQWILIILVVGAVFYICFPKYCFLNSGRTRCNQLTGTVERLYEGRWHKPKVPVAEEETVSTIVVEEEAVPAIESAE